MIGMFVRALAATSLLIAGHAFAQDRDPCAAGTVCASDPASVLLAMTKAGLEPRLGRDGAGDPLIESDAAPYHFAVVFFGCEQNRNCDSLRFTVQFRAGPENTLDLVNKWNAAHRFTMASLAPDGRLIVAYDVPTIGGTTDRNFADVLDWWVSNLEELAIFFRTELEPLKTGAERTGGSAH